LALEFRQTNLTQAVTQGWRTHLGFPHRVAEQRVKVGAETFKPACEICKVDLKRVSGRFGGIGELWRRTQPGFDDELMIALVQLNAQCRGLHRVAMRWAFGQG